MYKDNIKVIWAFEMVSVRYKLQCFNNS